MTDIEFFVDPSCPWAWVTAQWVREVAPQRQLQVTWRSYCLEIRDDYDVAPWVPASYREAALQGHALSHRMLRVMEAARARHGESAVDALYAAWGPLFFVRPSASGGVIERCVTAAGVDADLVDAADDEKWDTPIVASMEIAFAFGGPKTQTPTIVVRDDPPHGFKGPVMSALPAEALVLWDALMVVSKEPNVFEFTRPRANPPRPFAG
jgi:2-hydroxychromene-2-carboxylate isomerase